MVWDKLFNGTLSGIFTQGLSCGGGSGDCRLLIFMRGKLLLIFFFYDSKQREMYKQKDTTIYLMGIILICR